MGLPVLPPQIRELIASPSASFCEKFFAVFKIADYVHRIYSYFVSDSGKLTAEGAAFFCGLNCGGTGTGPGTGLLDPPVIQASDGAFLDRVRITWAVVAGATSYDIYRGLTDDSAAAGLLATSSSTTYDDTTAAPGTTYYFWARARNLNTTSALSNSDTGFAALELSQITDLEASQGTSYLSSRIALVWTPPTGAERYDIYRGLVDSFAAATKIATDRVPYDNSLTFTNGPTPIFLDNGGEVVYYDDAPSQFASYYFWVVAKAGSGASISPESNSAVGWAQGEGNGSTQIPLSSALVESGLAADDVPDGAVRAYIVLFGSGAGGAGAGLVYGGGGGGGGPVIHGKYTLETGGKIKVVSVPEAGTGRANVVTNGAAGSVTTFQYAEDGVTFATLMTANAPSGGVYSSTGGGAGGAGASGSVAGGVTASLIRNGRAGLPAMGSKGGRSGYSFSQGRNKAAHFLASNPAGYSGDGSAGNPAGSGSNAHPALGSLVFGGEGKNGYAIVFYYDA